MEISREQVKLIQLANLGLLAPPNRTINKLDVLNAIQQMGILQIDTIHVVARSPYFVIWSRLGNYDPEWLNQLHNEGHLFEYWAHAASFLPKEDYPLFRPLMKKGAYSWGDTDHWRSEHTELIDTVLDTILRNGPTCSADFKRPKKNNSGWWNWKDEKIALEFLWLHGELMVAYRKNFQRYYDLTERVYPEWKNKPVPNQSISHLKLIEKAIRILGATREKWVSDYFRIPKQITKECIDQLLSENRIIRVHNDTWEDGILIHKDGLIRYEQVLNKNLKASHTTLLSPFDPLIWDRERTRDLFGFDYTIECYLPAEKRKYGYFSLPILHNGDLVGRLDAKAHRKDKIFEIRQLHFEQDFNPTNDFSEAFMNTLKNCSIWHKCPQLEFSSVLKPPFN